MLTDASFLVGIPDLDLSHSPRLREVSCLKDVKKRLNLHFCNCIENVSQLGKIPTLILSCCNSISDISGLGQGNQVFKIFSHWII